MTENALNFECDWRFGLNLKPTRKGRVGYLLEWNGCGGLNLPKDIEVWNPYSTQGQQIVSGPRVQCVALLDSFRFPGGSSEPIRLKCWVSKATATNIRAKISRPMTSTKVKLAWYIIDYDDDQKVWYELAFVKNPSVAQARLDNVDGKLQIFVSAEGTRVDETLDLSLYAFEFQIIPAKNKRSDLEFASGGIQRVVKQWGT